MKENHPPLDYQPRNRGSFVIGQNALLLLLCTRFFFKSHVLLLYMTLVASRILYCSLAYFDYTSPSLFQKHGTLTK
jgi:hypothetical protein